jgi:hypothetical protein
MGAGEGGEGDLKTATKECDIPFTQYLMPNGRKVDLTIARTKEVYDKAKDIIKAGYRFEIEMLTTGLVHMTITDNDNDHDSEVVNNGPEVLLAVDRMITRFHEAMGEVSRPGS